MKAPGHDKGQPVLIKPGADGSYHVIGGAGHSLDGLRLTAVRSAESYKSELRDKQASKREEAKRRAQSDREMGLTESKSKAREVVRAQVGDAGAKYVEAVSKAMGWKPEATRFPEEQFQNATPAARQKAEADHAREIMQRAQEAVEQQRKWLLRDGEARAQAGLGEVPMTTDKPEEISVQDLDGVDPTGKGLGYSTDYGKRAEAAGLTPDELAAEGQAAKPPVTEGHAEAAAKRKDIAARVADELKAIREPQPKLDITAPVTPAAAAAVLKAEKQFKATLAEAKKKTKLINDADEMPEPNAYQLETLSRPVDHDVVKDLEDDLRTIQQRAFLDEVGKITGGRQSIGRHLGVGAYNSINALALASGGASLVDRSVVDVLGIAGAAQVLARRLRTDLTAEEMEDVQKAMAGFHSQYLATTEETLHKARDLQEQAAAIELPDAHNGSDMQAAQELNAKRREAVAEAQRILGTSLGEMEANAALVKALGEKRGQVHASLGKTSVFDGIRQARAIGLQRGDYQVEKVGGSTILTVHGSGLDKLAQPVSREDLDRVRGALDIIEGRRDEDNWLPEGVARRPDMSLNTPEGVAPRIAQPFPQSPGDVGQAVRDYIGGRAADGDAPADVVAGLLSEDTLQRAGDRAAFMAAVNEIAPLYDAKGGMIRAEAHAAAFDKLADAFVAKRGGDRTPIQRQNVTVDQTSVDALHRALAEHPDGVAAFKPVGDLTPQDQGALRNAFAREYGRTDPKAEALRQKVEALDKKEPEKESDGMFGRQQNPDWALWKRDRDAAAEEANGASMTWPKYVATHGSPERAYAAMQDVIRGNVLDSFAHHHNRLKPDAPLKLGRTAIAGDLAHLDALDPAARERRLADRRELTDRLRNRVAGKYSSGSVSDKLDAARASEEAASQAQMGLFGAEPEPEPTADKPVPERPMELGERRTIGHAAERTVAGMMGIVGRNFKPGQPTQIWAPTMSGKYVGRQRAVKLIEHDRRLVLAAGTGSGKTAIMLSGLTHLIAKGKAKRGLFVVPSVVQGQFHGEALTLLAPGRFQWHCNPGASQEERIAGYKNPDNHFSCITHQAFRDDMLHLAAKHNGSTPEAVSEKLTAMKPLERAAFMKEVLASEGIDHDYFATDEAHNLLNRKGKKDSVMATVVDAVAANMSTYISASADPVKNDASEAFDLLHKVAPERYPDREAFLRRYGVDTSASREGLKREMARHFYTGKIDPGVAAHKSEVSVPLSADQHAELGRVDKAAASARLARMKGGVDLDALKALSPSSFEGVDPAQHEAVGRDLNKSIGILRETAARHAIDGGAKTDAVVRLARERQGKPGLVFAHSLSRVREIADRLKAEGHRVVTLSGSDSTKDKAAKIAAYQRGDHDIMVASDAASVGANLQAGKWCCQYDTPMTAMTHAQRSARIFRQGQRSDVELIDLIGDHPMERRNRKRLSEKYDLREIMTSPLEGLSEDGIGLFLARARAAKGDGEDGGPAPRIPTGRAPSAPPPSAGEQSPLF